MTYVGSSKRFMSSGQVSDLTSGNFVVPSRGTAAGVQCYESIYSTILGSNTTTITLSSGGAWANYRHLELHLNIAGTGGAVYDLRIRPNGATSNFTSQRYFQYYSGGATIGTSLSTSDNGGAGKMLSTNNASHYILWFYEINNSLMNKHYQGFESSITNSTSSTDYQSGYITKELQSTTAVTSIDIYADGNTISAGTMVALYGIRY